MIGNSDDDLTLQQVLALAQTCAATKGAELKNLAVQLLNRPDLDRFSSGGSEALQVLRKYGDASDIATVQKYVNHPNRWIKLSAEKALQDITERRGQTPEVVAPSSQQPDSPPPSRTLQLAPLIGVESESTAWTLVTGLFLAAVGLVWWLVKRRDGRDLRR